MIHGQIATTILNLICETQKDQGPISLQSYLWPLLGVFVSLALILCLSPVIISGTHQMLLNMLDHHPVCSHSAMCVLSHCLQARFYNFVGHFRLQLKAPERPRILFAFACCLPVLSTVDWLIPFISWNLKMPLLFFFYLVKNKKSNQ